MYNELVRIASFILNAFLHIWPYLLITIPLAVAVKVSGAANYIHKAFSHRPHIAIILATLAGAFSPFCSCGVIPVVASLLLGGVPLAPVMSFWIASPSMDPEIFFLSAAALGWDLAVWRLAATLVLSLAAGYITHYLVIKNYLGSNYITIGTKKETFGFKMLVRRAIGFIRTKADGLVSQMQSKQISKVPAVELCCASAAVESISANGALAAGEMKSSPSSCGCSSSARMSSSAVEISLPVINSSNAYPAAGRVDPKDNSMFNRIRKETVSATLMVMKFMGLAFLLEGIIELYIPQNIIMNTMGGSNPFSVLWAALLGVPFYTSSLAALPLIGGLLSKGMSQGAALAFLIAGPVTTIPAMAAVYGLVNKKVFALYVGFAFFGALFFGYLLYLI